MKIIHNIPDNPSLSQFINGKLLPLDPQAKGPSYRLSLSPSQTTPQLSLLSQSPCNPILSLSQYYPLDLQLIILTRLPHLPIQPDKILKLMNLSPKKDEPDAEFQQMKDEVLTYDRVEAHPHKIVFSGPRTSNSERHKLQLLKKQEGITIVGPDWQSINKNIKKISSSNGKIIPIGPAIFRSNFECGNLNSVTMTAPNTYQIELQKESNSIRVSNWFYFSVEGIKGEAHFVIKGFTKSSSLYNEGMKVCYREVSEAAKWRRGGTKISYTNSIQDDEYKSTYQLRFSFFFKSNEPIRVQFACCFPYGLKRLYNLINQVKHVANYSSLCKSFNGLEVPLLTVGNPESKDVIVISARVHPGETVSSFIAEGFIKELVGEGDFGRVLRENFLIKIVPMLNPDGVSRGNYRFSGYGCDLNRKWKTCKQAYQPEIFWMRELIKSCNRDKKVIMYLDLHGHSRKKNVFFYGCSQGGNVKPMEFPFLMEKLSEAFKFQSCSFGIGKDKEGTARVTMWRELKIDYVYTLEATFCGPEYGTNYLQSDYERIGKKLCEGIAVFFYERIAKEAVVTSKALERLVRVKQKAFIQLAEHPQLLQIKKEDQTGSQSEPEAGQIPDKDRNTQTGLPKPDFLFRNKKLQKAKKPLLSPSLHSHNFSSFRQDRPSALTSESSLRERLNTIRKTQIHTDIEQGNQREQPYSKREAFPHQDIQVQLGDFCNLVEMPSNRSSQLHQQRNNRLYSLTRNADKHVGKEYKPPPASTQPCHEDPSRPEHRPHSKVQRESLLHGREGAQYRRVRKLAEQNSRKEQSAEMVHQLQGSQLYMSRLGRGGQGVAPRFYPLSQQKSRRVSVEIYMRRNRDEAPRSSTRRELSFKCTGTEIGKYKGEF